MAEFEPLDRHEHPALDVGSLEEQCLVLDNRLEVSVEELEHEVEVGLVAEHVDQLYGRRPASELWASSAGANTRLGGGLPRSRWDDSTREET